MTSLMPETIEPATGTLPLPRPSKTPRKSWTQAEVVMLVTSVQPPGRTMDECQAKMQALGLLPKPQKAALRGDLLDTLDKYVDAIAGFPDPVQRKLAIRYVQKSLSALPK